MLHDRCSCATVNTMMQARLIDAEIYTLRVLSGISGIARPARLPTLTTQLSGTWLSGNKHACLTDIQLPALLLGVSASGTHTNALSFEMRQAATAVADCPSKVGLKILVIRPQPAASFFAVYRYLYGSGSGLRHSQSNHDAKWQEHHCAAL